MKDKFKKSNMSCNASCGGAGGAFYFVGFLGAFVYFWQQSNGLEEHIIGIIKAIFWPAYMVYYLFEFLGL